MECVKLRHLSEFKFVINGEVYDKCPTKENVLVDLTPNKDKTNGQTITASATIELRNFSPILLGNPRIQFDEVVCTFENSISSEISHQIDMNELDVIEGSGIQVGPSKPVKNLSEESSDDVQTGDLRQTDDLSSLTSTGLQQLNASSGAHINIPLSLLSLAILCFR